MSLILYQALAHHTTVRKIAFTGSTLTGRAILKASAESNLKKISLELGGKSPTIVFDDADFDEAMTWAAIGITMGEGEICAAGSRIYVQETVYEKFLKAFSEQCKTATLGDPMVSGTSKGALISDQQREKVSKYIEGAKANGTPLLHGGKRIGDSNAIENTAFFDVPDDSAIMKEEIFGPVAVSFQATPKAWLESKEECPSGTNENSHYSSLPNSMTRKKSSTKPTGLSTACLHPSSPKISSVRIESQTVLRAARSLSMHGECWPLICHLEVCHYFSQKWHVTYCLIHNDAMTVLILGQKGTNKVVLAEMAGWRLWRIGLQSRQSKSQCHGCSATGAW